MIGRESELAQLQEWLADSVNGKRKIVFITGEAGIGKTAIIDALVEQVRQNCEPWIGRGQCVEHYGIGEPYLPVLEALGRLCRGPKGKQLIGLLNQHAPTWLIQMPALLGARELQALQAKLGRVTQERMLREMAEAIEVFTRECLLLLILEDLHWSDYSTVALLSALARRQEPARLLIIGAYRSAEVLSNGHPLRSLPQELQLHGYSHALPLVGLSQSAIADYVSRRFPHHQFPFQLAQFVYERTEGNPLFMVNVVDALERQAFLAQANEQWVLQRKLEKAEIGVPDTLKQMIEQHIEDCDETVVQILSAASVVGVEFSSAAVAAGLHQRCRAQHAALESATLLITLAEKHNLPSRRAAGMIYHGWALAKCGQVQEGLAQLCSGLNAMEATEAILARPYYLALLGEVSAQAGRIEGALRALQEALTIVQANDDRVYEAEVWRLQGELILQQSRIQHLTSSIQENQKAKGKTQKTKTTNS